MSHSQSSRDSLTARLYCAMPGAPLPPIIDGAYAWDLIQGNDQWEFCATIVEVIEAMKGGDE